MITEINDRYKAQGVSLYVSVRQGSITLHEIIVPKDRRKKGTGSSYMEELCNYADKIGSLVLLSPSKDFGASSVNRLKCFYKRFGFKENKGRNKDFRFSETMIRQPK